MNVEHCVSLAASDTYWHYTCFYDVLGSFNNLSVDIALNARSWRAMLTEQTATSCLRSFARGFMQSWFAWWKMRIEDIWCTVLPVWQFCMILADVCYSKYFALAFPWSSCRLWACTSHRDKHRRKKEEPIWSPRIRWWNIWLYTWENIWHTERAFFKDI